MTTQHTPGPWEASFVAERFIIHYTPGHGVGKRAIACCAGIEPANPFNGLLIAAAPELLEALVKCAAVLKAHKIDCIERDLASAAIAKATGGK